jgi:Xaa-Pro aminopeptidase
VREYQRRIEQARLEYQQMRAIEAPEEAELGQGELEMQDVSSSLVQKRLSELEWEVGYIIEACNEEKEVLEDAFDSVQSNIKILETRIYTDKHRIDADVAGVGTQLQLQEAVLQELRSGINILQGQDAQIVQEANDIFITH